MRGKPSVFEKGQPFLLGIVTNMGGIAQHLDRLEIGIEEGLGAACDVDATKRAAQLQNSMRFFQRDRNLPPMMRAVATYYRVVTRVFKRKLMHRPLHGFDVDQPALRSFRRDNVQHLPRQVVSSHVLCIRSYCVSKVPCSAAEIKHV